MAASRSKRFPAAAWPALAVASLLLAGCQNDAPPPTVVSAPGTAATWRVVVWGAGDERDARLGDAIGQELLRRGLAASIVTAPGPTDHVLQVTASPVVFPAQESVRDGRDSRLLVQANYRSEMPAASLGASTIADPTRALAVTIALRIAADPLFAPKPSPVPKPALPKP